MLTRETENWDEDQQWESDWWGNCANTMAEEVKQISYAHRMGLLNEPRDGKWPVYDLAGKSVIDIGGGPVSMLLKTVNGGELLVADPCPYPSWVNDRYAIHGIDYEVIAGEDLLDPVKGLSPHGIHLSESEQFDEAWIYNVLQHVQDPAKILDNARKLAKVVRIFEWVDIPPHTGHPHELKAQKLGEWLGGSGVVEQMNENGCNGRAFYGVFSGIPARF